MDSRDQIKFIAYQLRMVADQIEQLVLPVKTQDLSSMIGRARKRWNRAEDSQLRKLIENKIPINSIAETLNRSTHSIIRRAGILTRRKARVNKVEKKPSKKRTTNFNHPQWGGPEISRLKELYASNKYSVEEMAIHIGRSKASVYSMIAKLKNQGKLNESDVVNAA